MVRWGPSVRSHHPSQSYSSYWRQGPAAQSSSADTAKVGFSLTRQVFMNVVPQRVPANPWTFARPNLCLSLEMEGTFSPWRPDIPMSILEFRMLTLGEHFPENGPYVWEGTLRQSSIPATLFDGCPALVILGSPSKATHGLSCVMDNILDWKATAWLLCYALVVWAWASHRTPLGFGFPSHHKMKEPPWYLTLLWALIISFRWLSMWYSQFDSLDWVLNCGRLKRHLEKELREWESRFPELVISLPPAFSHSESLSIKAEQFPAISILVSWAWVWPSSPLAGGKQTISDHRV